MDSRAAIPSLALIVACAAIAGPPPTESNLLDNPGFESGADRWHLPKTFSIDEGAARSGARCIRVENTNAALYQLARQPIAFEPGLRYRYGAWVKTRGVRGDESGATLCMEWSGTNGWLGGHYIDGRKGDNDWTHIEGTTGPIPEGAKSVDLKLYLRKGMTGTAWFDDATVSAVWPLPMDAQLLRPNYRGWMLPGDTNRAIVVRAIVSDRLRGNVERTATRLTCDVLDASGAIPLSKTLEAPAPGRHDIGLDGGSLPPGEYRARVALRAAGGAPLGAREFPLRVWAPGSPPPAAHIDGASRTIVRGKPFFPLGWYFGPGPAARDFRDHIDRVAASPFNTIMCYGINSGDADRVRAYLDYLDSKGLKIIYSIKDVFAGTKYFHEPVLGFRGEEAIVRGIVAAFRDHPALLGWYLNDELPPSMRDRLEARYRLVRELDPGHPTWAVLYQVDELFGYLDTADVLGTDPYPIPAKPVTIASDWAKKTDGVSGGHRPVWMVPQAFDWSHYHKDRPGRFPTRDELRVMTYLCLIHGADGLVYYCYHDLLRDPASFEKNWADMSEVGREVRLLEPALVSARGTPPFQIQTDAAAVQWAARSDDSGKAFIMMANPDPVHAAKVRAPIPPGSVARLLRGESPIAASSGEVDLPPMGAATLVIEKQTP